MHNSRRINTDTDTDTKHIDMIEVFRSWFQTPDTPSITYQWKNWQEIRKFRHRENDSLHEYWIQ